MEHYSRWYWRVCWFFRKLTNVVDWISILLLLWTFSTYLHFVESRFKYFWWNYFDRPFMFWIKNLLLSSCIPFESFLAHIQTDREKIRRILVLFPFLTNFLQLFLLFFLTCVLAILDDEDYWTSKCDCRADSKTQ